MISTRLSRLLFWALILGLLIPVWFFPFIPTHDGPAHLATARVLERCARDVEPFTTYFEIRWQPVPNWSIQAVLWGLLLAFPAEIAHKLLVTGYVVGFACAFRRLALVVCPHAVALPLLGVLVCYCRCFWMGFYNYCFSVVLLLWILSHLMSRRHLTNAGACLLGGVWVLAYLTHLLGYLIIVTASVVTILFLYEARWRCLAKAAVALVPSACLVGWYVGHTEMVESSRLGSLLQSTSAELFSSQALGLIEQHGIALNTQIFGPLALEALPLGWCLLAFLFVLFQVTLATSKRVAALPPTADEERQRGIGLRWPIAAMLVGSSFAYVFGPEHIGGFQGGYIKQRFAVLLPLLLALLCREPAMPEDRPTWRVLTVRTGLLTLFLAAYACLLANLWLYCAAQNRVLQEFTAGREALGSGRVVAFLRPTYWNAATSDPLAHAVDYYCLDGDCLNLENYQAGTPYFPIRFAGDANLRREELTNAVVVWDLPDPSRRSAFRDFRLAFAEGRLRIFLRKGNDDPDRP